MPVIHVYHPRVAVPMREVLSRLCAQVAANADLPADKVWALSHVVEDGMCSRPDWDGSGSQGPIVRVFCRRSHSRRRVESIVAASRATLAESLSCAVGRVFVQVIRVDDEDVFNIV